MDPTYRFDQVDAPEQAEPFTVTQAMNTAKRALERVQLTVRGEVSELSDKPGYKAVYFTLRDTGASMSCLMWHDAYASSGRELRTGLVVEATGMFTAYVPKGRMNFVVRTFRLAGEGDLRAQVALLAKKLEREGLMDPQRKRTIPAYPESIAVVTSPRGKAVHDCMRTLRRRYPLAELLVCGVPVEGADAPAHIIEGLKAAAAAHPDVILLVRGGGSYEDLMPFNDERLARAIAACPVPVVTGIGHEPDNSIADMVSDLRCSTPTAAAEKVAPDRLDILSDLSSREARLAQALSGKVASADLHLKALSSRPVFTDPAALLSTSSMQVDAVASRLEHAIPDALVRDSERISYLQGRLGRAGDAELVRFDRAMAVRASRLQDLSPLSVLSRGYAMATDESGTHVIDSVSKAAAEDRIRVRVSDGSIACVVTGTTPYAEGEGATHA